jgi:hypothetical protein
MAGCCVSLAINSNVFTGVIFGIFCAVYVAFAVLYGFGRRTLLTRAVMFTAGFTLVAAGGYAYYWHVFGEPRNIFRPTFEMASHLSRGGMKVYRVAGYQWLYNRFDVMVPVLLALCCLAISVRRHTRFEVAVCAASGTNVIAFFFVHQFLLEGDTLQLPYYTSYAIPTTFLMLICIGQSLWERFGGRAWVFLTVSLTATLTPLLLISAGVFWIAQFKAPAWAVMAVVTLAIVFSAGVQWRGRVLRITLAVSSLAMLALSMAAGLFVTYHVIRPFSSRDDNEIIVYRVALQLIKEAPKLSDGPGRLIFWYNDREQNPIRSVQSTFLWSISKMNQSPPEGLGMPNLGPFQMLQLRNYDVRYLVLLGERPEEVQAGLQAITRAKVGYDLLATRDLHSGTFHVYFQLIELTTRPPEPGEAAPK